MNDQQEYAELIAILSQCDKKLLGDFLQDILTPNEVRELCQRWRVIKMLATQTPQRVIAKTLKTSLCKITRGSRELKKKNSSLLKALKLKPALD